jgi:pimeloyl-ACP methyl ester carboxylesterase
LSKTKTSQTEKIILKSNLLGKIQLYLRQPIGSAKNENIKLPTVFFLAGIDSRQEYMDLLPKDITANIVLFDFQLTPLTEKLKNGDFATEAPASILKMAIAYDWLMRQPMVDKNTVFSLNISFGAFFAPAALHLLREMGHKPMGTAFAFGGADIYSVLESHAQPLADQIIKPEVKAVIQSALAAIGPMRHLKHLHGPFLVIRGLQDEMVPEVSSEALYEALPGEKTLVLLDTPHIVPERKDVIQMTIKEFTDWSEQLILDKSN